MLSIAVACFVEALHRSLPIWIAASHPEFPSFMDSRNISSPNSPEVEAP